MLQPHVASMSSLLRRCLPLSSIQPGKQIHAQILARGFLPHVTLQTDLMLVYSKCNCVGDAQRIFDEMPQRNMHSWNVLISSYVQKSLYDGALTILTGFLDLGLRPDHFTFPSLFKACAGIGDSCLGKSLHNWVIRLGWEDHVVVRSSILDFYGKCGWLVEAYRLFLTTTNRDVVVWNSMISAFGRAGFSEEVLGAFRRMQQDGLNMDSRTIPSILNACGRQGALMKGKEIHGQVIKNHSFNCDVAIGNSLIDMYAKCGCLNDSRKVFTNMCDWNIITWTTMISCYGVHGQGEEALALFEKMKSSGFNPNSVTFTAILASCSHAGLIDRGQKIFDSIRLDYGIEPGVEHYACLVDLLGRCGQLNEAHELIKGMPVEPTASVWGALLGACQMHNNVALGEFAAFQLFDLEAGNSSNYIALRSIYDALGRWDDKVECIDSIRGISPIHFKKEIYEMLDRIMETMSLTNEL
ncbi:hypothetical protein ACLOJK_013903 [Asimina triloba]